MEIKIKCEEITNELKNIATVIADSNNTRTFDDSDEYAKNARRLADIEARMQKLESLLLKQTMAGNTTLTPIGRDVNRFYNSRREN